MKNVEVFSFLSFGYEGRVVKVEADLKSGLPNTEIVGLPGGAVKEARERVRVAIKNSGFEYPFSRILINLCPASEKKEGSGFDLPIALAVLSVNEELTADKAPPCLVIGELELSGRVRKVSGVLAAISCGLKAGIKHFIVPTENKNEALISKNCKVFGVDTLNEAFESLKKIATLNDVAISCKMPFSEKAGENNSFKVFWSEPVKSNYSEVKGQEQLLYALEIAAAGGHNLLAYGPPGCGKSLALKKFGELLPDLDFKTSEELTRIYSIAGLLDSTCEEVLIRRPPFRTPHQSASLEGIIGGAGKCLPGEISLAHGGVLFLDEATQFKATVLQSLRAPLETGFVSLSRAEKRTRYPARFQLLLALNPCDCGNLGSSDKFCTCSPLVVDRYWKKLTAPLLDRIDLRLFVTPPNSSQLLAESSNSSEKMRSRVKLVYETSKERNQFYYQKQNYNEQETNFFYFKNALIQAEFVNKICILTREAEKIFTSYFEKNSLSGRGSHAILKIARTIADLEQSEKINSACLETALSLRKFNPLLPDFL
ncbi:MAG: YifB family Mg chelatase-like AAA ATPase [Treponemataceae bacterium]